LTVTLLVWVDDWQQQCCGEPFAIGSTVDWMLSVDFSPDWMADVLGPSVGAEVTHVEDHHGLAPEGTPVTHGAVTRIRAASCRYAPDNSDPEGRTYAAVRGTGRLDELQEADPWFEPPAPLEFKGFVVDLGLVRG